MLEREAVLSTVVQFLKDKAGDGDLTNLKRPDACIRVMTDDDAIPAGGEEFFGITGNDTENLYPPSARIKRLAYTFVVNYIRRVNSLPNERVGEDLLTYKIVQRVKPSIEKRCMEIANAIDVSYELMGLINAALSTSGGCFIIPFGFITHSEVEQINADAFDLPEEDSRFPNRYIGLRTKLTFGGAEYFLPR